MYTPAPFAEERLDVLYGLIRRHPLATLVSAADGIEASHLPIVLDAESKMLRGHMARANHHWKTLDAATVLVIFQGPEHYISPSWYPSKQEHGKVVPTWNYLAVHVTGRTRISHDPSFLLRNVTDLTNHNEAPFAAPWRVADAPPSFIEGLTKAIVGFEISMDRIEGKWKLSQNRGAEDQQGIIANLEALGTPSSREMAALIKSRRSS